MIVLDRFSAVNKSKKNECHYRLIRMTTVGSTAATTALVADHYRILEALPVDQCHHVRKTKLQIWIDVVVF